MAGDASGSGGHEFYMKAWPELVGERFGDVLFRPPGGGGPR